MFVYYQVESSGNLVSSAAPSSSTSQGSQDAATDTRDVAIVTDPDCLGPCEPGTQVTLEGIVWHESENGELFKLTYSDFKKSILNLLKRLFFKMIYVSLIHNKMVFNGD
jgi:hypothetical protein